MAPGVPSIKITSNSRQELGEYARQIKPNGRVDAGDDPAPADGEVDSTGGLCFLHVVVQASSFCVLTSNIFGLDSAHSHGPTYARRDVSHSATNKKEGVNSRGTGGGSVNGAYTTENWYRYHDNRECYQ